MTAPPFPVAKDRVRTETQSMIQQVGRLLVAREGSMQPGPVLASDGLFKPMVDKSLASGDQRP
jgi:hypothetical protein